MCLIYTFITVGKYKYKYKYKQGMKMLLASGCECFIEVGLDKEVASCLWTVRLHREDGVECDMTCGLRYQNKQHLFELRNDTS